MKDNKQITNEIIKIIENEPEFESEMPQEMKIEIMKGDIDVITEAIRIAVRLTKRNIVDRIKKIEL